MPDKKDKKSEPEPSGVRPPPRPPRRTAVGLGPEGDDSNERIIKLPPKPSAAPTIKPPWSSGPKTGGTNLEMTRDSTTHEEKSCRSYWGSVLRPFFCGRFVRSIQPILGS